MPTPTSFDARHSPGLADEMKPPSSLARAICAATIIDAMMAQAASRNSRFMTKSFLFWRGCSVLNGALS